MKYLLLLSLVAGCTQPQDPSKFLNHCFRRYDLKTIMKVEAIRLESNSVNYEVVYKLLSDISMRYDDYSEHMGLQEFATLFPVEVDCSIYYQQRDVRSKLVDLEKRIDKLEMDKLPKHKTGSLLQCRMSCADIATGIKPEPQGWLPSTCLSECGGVK